MESQQTDAPPAALTLQEWVRMVGVCSATYYNVLPADRPKSTYAGRRLLIIESPSAWLARMAAQGGARTKHWARKQRRESPPSRSKSSRAAR